MSRHGWLTLCANENDARHEALESDRIFPETSPHKAVRMVLAEDLDVQRCENARLRQCMQEVAEELEALDEANAQIQAAVLRKCIAD
jgi:hypothetical protein